MRNKLQNYQVRQSLLRIFETVPTGFVIIKYILGYKYKIFQMYLSFGIVSNL